MLRLSQVAKLLQQPVSKVTNDLVIKGNGRHLIVYNQEVYSFPSTKNVIIPFDLAAKYAKISHQKKIHPPPQLSDLLKPLDKTEVGKTKHSIAVLLGHFNHGKTTLLDTLINYTNSSKNSDLVSEEKHGITQEVRTKSIQIADDHYLTLIDTPGQEIFYRMRNHGAAVADMGLLLISMADGICRQTEESIGILESLRIPVVVCLNKLDLLPQKTEEERQERIRQFIEECKVFKALDSPSATFVPISAKNSIHIDKLIQEIERVSSIVKSSGKRIKGIKHEYLTGKGYVLNIIHDRYSGQTLHIVMTAGSMKVGDYFVAGGWSGRVKLIVTTNDDELLRVSSNSSTTRDNDENLIRKGIAVKLTASFHPDIGNPRPLGDDIYFFSGRNLPDLTTNKDMKKLQDKLKEETEYFMDQNFMFESFESHHLSEEERDRLKINKALLNQKGLTPFYKHVLSLHPSLKEDESSEEEVESNDSEDDDIPLPPKGLVIIKASSDIEISTIHDVYEDELNAAAKIPSSQEGKQKKFGPKKIIFSGVGQLSFKDTELARLGQATLLCYNVGIDKLALQNLKSHSLKVVHFERVQDVLDYLFDRKTVDA